MSNKISYKKGLPRKQNTGGWGASGVSEKGVIVRN